MNTNGVQLVDVVDLNSAFGIKMFVLNLAIAGVHVHFPNVYVKFDGDVMDVSTGRIYTTHELVTTKHNYIVLPENSDVVQVWIDEFNRLNDDMKIKPFPLELH